MKFYRVSQTVDHGASHGFEFFTRKADADKCAREWPGGDGSRSATVEIIEITPTKAGILDALTQYAGHADNG